MDQNQSHADNVEKSVGSSGIPPGLGAAGKKRLDEVVAIQTQQSEKFKEGSQRWSERMQSEMKFASEFSAKPARSLPEMTTVGRDAPVGKRTSSELVKLVNKLRWLGMEQEAEQVQIVLRRVDPAATLLGGPWDTD
jgi:hypothetical protein